MCWKNKIITEWVCTLFVWVWVHVLKEQRSAPSECECTHCAPGYEYKVLEEQRSGPSEYECVLCASGYKYNVLEEQRSAPSECECVLCLSGFEYNVLEEQRSAPSECECVLCLSGCKCGYHCKTKYMYTPGIWDMCTPYVWVWVQATHSTS